MSVWPSGNITIRINHYLWPLGAIPPAPALPLSKYALTNWRNFTAYTDSFLISSYGRPMNASTVGMNLKS